MIHVVGIANLAWLAIGGWLGDLFGCLCLWMVFVPLVWFVSKRKPLLLPCVLALIYFLLATFFIRNSGEWALGLLRMLAFPVGYFFEALARAIPLRSHEVYSFEPFLKAIRTVYLVGGTIWYFCLGLLIRWLRRRYFARTRKKLQAGQPDQTEAPTEST